MSKKTLWIAGLIIILGLCAWQIRRIVEKRRQEIDVAGLSAPAIPVKTATPEWIAFSEKLESHGILLPSKEMPVIAETPGRVVAVFKEKGDRIREGELIAQLDDEPLRIELEIVRANLAKLNKDRERLKNLTEEDAVARNKIEEAELAILTAEAKEKTLENSLKKTAIRAPMTGIVGMRQVERGSVVAPGTPIAYLADLDKLLLVVKVSEREILQLRKGQVVRVIADVMPERALSGKISHVGLKADNAFNYDVEIETLNPPGAPLRGGMHAKAVFDFGEGRKAMAIPRKTIVGSLKDPKVYVVENGIARLRPVVIGAVQKDYVEVVSGLEPSSAVVSSGQINLSDGAQVQ
ncbi:MAG: efflux RND transporter periplasmic adaptor subunit [Saprospiraceae bacterium]